MPSTATDRLNGLTTSVAVKAPCRGATTGAVTLLGEQTIDGVALVSGDRELVKNQVNPIENGIYVVASGAWVRAADFNGSLDAVGGTQVLVTEGAENRNSYWKVDGEGPVDPNLDAITFSPALIDDSATAAFIASGVDAVARTMQDKGRDFPTPQDIGIALEPTSQGIGEGVLRVITSGVKNTGFGYHALQNNTDGSENTAFGYRALSGAVGGVDPDGDYNTAFGSFALASLTTGFKNAAFGRAAGDNLTTGSQNAAIGYGSLHWGTIAQNVVAVGFEAVHGGVAGPVTAQGVVGVGFHALYECLTGNFNTAVGTSSLASLTTGARNTGIGTNALNGLVAGNDNVGVGYGAGTTNTGSGNIFIGAGADANAGLANVTVIGTSMAATASNTLLLGNGQTVIPGTTAADFGSSAKPWNFGIFANSLVAMNGTAIPAGGTTGKGFLLSSTANFGVFFGSGAPALSAAKGSLYLRSNGSTTNDRAYINTDGGTTWTALTTAA